MTSQAKEASTAGAVLEDLLGNTEKRAEEKKGEAPGELKTQVDGLKSDVAQMMAMLRSITSGKPLEVPASKVAPEQQEETESQNLGMMYSADKPSIKFVFGENSFFSANRDESMIQQQLVDVFFTKRPQFFAQVDLGRGETFNMVQGAVGVSVTGWSRDDAWGLSLGFHGVPVPECANGFTSLAMKVGWTFNPKTQEAWPARGYEWYLPNEALDDDLVASIIAHYVPSFKALAPYRRAVDSYIPAQEPVVEKKAKKKEKTKPSPPPPQKLSKARPFQWADDISKSMLPGAKPVMSRDSSQGPTKKPKL